MTKPLPQIAFVNKNNWGIISRHHREVGKNLSDMPSVSCPIVDTSQINPQEKALLLRKYIEPHGVTNMPALLARLIKAGGVVLNSKRAA